MPDGLQGRSFDDRSNSSSTPQLEVLARQSAVLMVFENAHWIAPHEPGGVQPGGARDRAATRLFCGDYAAANTETDELGSLAHEKGAPFWKTNGTLVKGCVWALTGKASNAIEMIRSASDQMRSTGTALCAPWYLLVLATGYAELG